VLLTLSLAGAETKFPIDKPVDGEPFRHSVSKIGDGLYLFRWWVYRNIFIVTDDGVIVTDPMNPKAAKLLQSETRKITDKPVRYVLYSHNHHDHISGGTVFEEEGAQFVAHKNVLKQLADHPSPVIPEPEITFEESYTVELGGKNPRVELLRAQSRRQPGGGAPARGEDSLYCRYRDATPGRLPHDA
jgi:glyoxylase-like metal-dependent hydrolase (beta-lactamase superfamily II)